MEKKNYPLYRYTTPAIVLKFRGLDLEDVDVLRIKLARGRTAILRTTAEPEQVAVDTEAGTATISLTQQESAAFSGGLATVQAHIKLRSGAVLATNRKQIYFDENLDEEEL